MISIVDDSGKEVLEGDESLPFFDPGSNVTTNLTVQMGSDVFLSCPVQHLGQYRVSEHTLSFKLFHNGKSGDESL